MKKRALFLPIVLLTIVLLSGIVNAQLVVSPKTFFVEVEAVNDIILNPVKDFADFYVVVENKGSQIESYKLLYLDDPKWSYQALPDPLAKTITVAPGEKGRIHILVKGAVDRGLYGVKVSVQSLSTGNRIDNVMKIRVGEPPKKEPPKPDFGVVVSVPAQMDPRGTYNVVVALENKNERLLEDVSIQLAGRLITEETKITVGPNETKSVSFAILLLDNIEPQESSIYVTVSYEDQHFYDAEHAFKVVEFVPPFTTDIKVDKKFLRQNRLITITNEGNTIKTDAVRIETSLKEKFFSSSKPKFRTLKEDGRYFFAWDVSLEPDEATQIKLSTSYRLLLLIALVIIALLVYKIGTSNPLIVKKKIMSVHKQGGAISNFAVVIYLKNKGKETISKLRAVERVPGMVQLKTDSFAGSMHPVKMHAHNKEGTLLEYRFAELTAGDERIIKYKVYSKLNIFGSLVIKPTVVEFFKKNGTKRKSSSNRLTVTAEEPAETSTARTVGKKGNIVDVRHRDK